MARRLWYLSACTACFIANALLAVPCIQLLQLLKVVKCDPASTSIVNESWQSSVSEGRCYLPSVRSASSTSLASFTSGDEPDRFDYQWLLLRLARAARLQSVSVYAKPDDNSGVRDLEVLISDQRPTGLIPLSGTCRATLEQADGANKFVSCKRGEASEEWQCGVECPNCPPFTRYILLRRSVQKSQANKRLEFSGFKVNSAVQLFRVSSRFSCSTTGLDRLTSGETAKLMACEPCENASLQCSIPNSTKSSPTLHWKRISAAQFSHQITIGGNFRNKQLECSYQCEDGSTEQFKRVVGFISKPKDLHLSMGAPRWVIGAEALVTFKTDPAFPQPLHRCELMRLGLPARELAVKEDELTDCADGLTSRSSTFSLAVDESLRGGTITCASTLANTSEVTKKMKPVPDLIHLCKTEFQQPPEAAWQPNASFTFSVSTSTRTHGNECVNATHTCYLVHKHGETPLTADSTSGTSSRFSLIVKPEWSTYASVTCSVNHSGLFVMSVTSTLRSQPNTHNPDSFDLSYTYLIVSVVLCSALATFGISATLVFVCHCRDRSAAGTPDKTTGELVAMTALPQGSSRSTRTMTRTRATELNGLEENPYSLRRTVPPSRVSGSEDSAYDLLVSTTPAHVSTSENPYTCILNRVTPSHMSGSEENANNFLRSATPSHVSALEENAYKYLRTATPSRVSGSDENAYNFLREQTEENANDLVSKRTPVRASRSQTAYNCMRSAVTSLSKSGSQENVYDQLATAATPPCMAGSDNNAYDLLVSANTPAHVSTRRSENAYSCTQNAVTSLSKSGSEENVYDLLATAVTPALVPGSEENVYDLLATAQP